MDKSGYKFVHLTMRELFTQQEMVSFNPKPPGCEQHTGRFDRQGQSFLEKWHGDGNRHYWLTPPQLMDELQAEFDFDFDPCPYPLPEDFDGLICEWGKSNYVNPPFGAIMHEGKKKGPTAWANKALEEHRKGKTVVLVYPVDKWMIKLLAAGAELRNLGDVRWLAVEDGTPGKGTGRHICAFILRA